MSRKRHKVKVAIERLEMTRGHDGFLRGHPEPALLLAHMRVGQQRMVLCERLLVRFQPRGRFPLIAPFAAPADMRTRLRLAAIPEHLLLVFAFEEDGGADIQRFHALLDDTAELSVWQVAADIPAPVPLPDAARWTGGPHRVRLLEGNRDAADRCRADTLVDCAVVPLERRIYRDVVRIPLRSDDGRNDWIADVRVEVSKT